MNYHWFWNLSFKKFEWINMKFIRLIYYYLIKRNSNKFNYYSKYNDAIRRKMLEREKITSYSRDKSNLEWNYKRIHHKIFVNILLYVIEYNIHYWASNLKPVQGILFLRMRNKLSITNECLTNSAPLSFVVVKCILPLILEMEDIRLGQVLNHGITTINPGWG